MCESANLKLVPPSISKRLDEIMSNPIPIELRSDGTLNIDEDVSVSEFIERISERLPQTPDLSECKDEEVRKKIKCIYQVNVISQVLGYTTDFIEMKLEAGMSYEDIRQKLSELGKDVEIILSACSRAFTIQQVTEQQWGKYHLRFEEVTRLESVASLRREINVRRSVWETSKDYLNASKEVKANRESKFEEELKEVTDDLWRILHLGVNYLSGSERLKIKLKTDGFSKKERQSYVDEELIKLRRAYLASWRVDPSNFAFPSVKS